LLLFPEDRLKCPGENIFYFTLQYDMHFLLHRTVTLDLHPNHKYFPGPTLILLEIVHLVNGEGRSLELGDIRLQELLLPPAKRFDYLISVMMGNHSKL
jgi:hypothetical protein